MLTITDADYKYRRQAEREWRMGLKAGDTVYFVSKIRGFGMYPVVGLDRNSVAVNGYIFSRRTGYALGAEIWKPCDEIVETCRRIVLLNRLRDLPYDKLFAAYDSVTEPTWDVFPMGLFRERNGK